jgi:hypothetical protein
VGERLLITLHGRNEEALPPDIGAQLEEAQGPQSQVAEILDVGLRGPDRLGFAGTTSQYEKR